MKTILHEFKLSLIVGLVLAALNGVFVFQNLPAWLHISVTLVIMIITIAVNLRNYHNKVIVVKVEEAIEKLQDENAIIPFERLVKFLEDKPTADVASEILKNHMINLLKEDNFFIAVLFGSYSIYEELYVYVEDDCKYNSAFTWLELDGWIKDYNHYILFNSEKKKFIFCARPGKKLLDYARKLDKKRDRLNSGGCENTSERILKEIDSFSVVKKQLGE